MKVEVGNGPAERPAVDGLLLLNKPAGMTSNRALQMVKRLVGARKAGHTGSLDPAATGMLPICLGEATKVAGFLLDAPKTYRVTVRLGEQTDTGDADGAVTETAAVPALTADEWRKVLDDFLGDSKQIPPMYSALKQDGRRLYELARRGDTVARDPRPISIHDIGLLEASGRRLVFRVRCSKGTYIRVLVEDVAAAAGTVAHTANLHRESVAGFPSGGMIDLSGLRRLAESGRESLLGKILPVDAALMDWPAARLEPEQAERFRCGQAVPWQDGDPGLLRVYAAADRLLGIGEAATDGTLAPKRIFRLGEKSSIAGIGQKKA